MSHKKLLITKSDGQIVHFDRTKLANTLQKTGTDKKTIKSVINAVEPKIKNKMKTSDIFQMIQTELYRKKPWAAARLNLRDAIFKLGPAGYNFEKYVAAILTAYGYKTQLPDELQGACVTHEVDVTAEKNGRTSFIEAKFRHDFRGTVAVKDTLATWARFLDLVDGARVGLCPHFDEAWIVTNARFTEQSLQYGHCKNMMLIGWNHPHERTFASMVDVNSLYPVTIIRDLSNHEVEAFAQADIMLCREVCGTDIDQLSKITGIQQNRLERVVKDCHSIINGDKS